MVADQSESDRDDATARPRPRMPLTRELRRPTEYVKMLNGEFSRWALNEERAPEFKARWRSEVFRTAESVPLDLEIGTGNGYHFAHLAKSHPDRCLVGLELKFKPLIQSIRRALRAGGYGEEKPDANVRIVRYDANCLVDLFGPGELDNVYIHHPDPWPKKRHWKHRLIQDRFLDELDVLMRPGAFVDFKTDSLDYFEWAVERFHRSKFKVVRETRDLHRSEWSEENFVTHFESIFLSQGLKIHYARLLKPQ